MTRITVLFLPGTGLPDTFYRPLLNYLNQYGEVVKWVYRHGESMVEACRRLGNQADLYGKLRSEVCFGYSETGNSRLGLGEDDAICAWYEKQVEKECIQDLWKRTLVVGHSQGAGHALMISQKRELMGALMIAGPADSAKGQAADWTKGAYATPNSRRMILVHRQDAGYRAILAHSVASGLVVREKSLCSTDNTCEGGLAIVETKPVSAFSAHGCLAGGQTWEENGPLYESYHHLTRKVLTDWLQPD